MTEYTKMYKCQILFSSTTLFFLERFTPSLPSCSFSLNLSTSHLLLAPPGPLRVALRIVNAGTLSHRCAALHWWKSECVESLVELHCMYCIYGIKIVFCSSPVSVPPLLCPPVVTQVLQGTLQDNWLVAQVGKNNNNFFKKRKQFILFSNKNDGNLQFPVFQTPCWLLSWSKQTINTSNNC